MKKLMIIIALLLIIPISFSEDPVSMDVESIRTLAETQAKDDVSKLIWFSGGCAFNFWAIMGGMIYEPNPPAAMMVGRSPQYVEVLRDYYKREAQRIQTKSAVWGCAASTFASIALAVGFIWYWEVYGYPEGFTY